MVRVEVVLRLVYDTDEDTAKLMNMLPYFDKKDLGNIISKLIPKSDIKVIQVKKLSR